jgi:hypothetical protein
VFVKLVNFVASSIIGLVSLEVRKIRAWVLLGSHRCLTE